MSRRILRRYYAQERKKRALFFSLCLHGIAASSLQSFSSRVYPWR